MKIKSRAILFLLAILVTGLGLACLNYTAFGNHEHHVEWSQGKGFPEPSFAIFAAGAGMAVLGGILLGWGIKR
jgi:hypothetical protein